VLDATALDAGGDAATDASDAAADAGDAGLVACGSEMHAYCNFFDTPAELAGVTGLNTGCAISATQFQTAPNSIKLKLAATPCSLAGLPTLVHPAYDFYARSEDAALDLEILSFHGLTLKLGPGGATLSKTSDPTKFINKPGAFKKVWVRLHIVFLADRVKLTIGPDTLESMDLAPVPAPNLLFSNTTEGLVRVENFSADPTP
jgi:hypothetical protein